MLLISSDVSHVHIIQYFFSQLTVLLPLRIFRVRSRHPYEACHSAVPLGEERTEDMVRF